MSTDSSATETTIAQMVPTKRTAWTWVLMPAGRLTSNVKILLASKRCLWLHRSGREGERAFSFETPVKTSKYAIRLAFQP